MLTITTECGVVLTGSTDVELAVKYQHYVLPADWDESASPFDEHMIFHEVIEEVHYLLDLQATN